MDRRERIFFFVLFQSKGGKHGKGQTFLCLKRMICCKKKKKASYENVVDVKEFKIYVNDLTRSGRETEIIECLINEKGDKERRLRYR